MMVRHDVWNAVALNARIAREDANGSKLYPSGVSSKPVHLTPWGAAPLPIYWRECIGGYGCPHCAGAL